MDAPSAAARTPRRAWPRGVRAAVGLSLFAAAVVLPLLRQEGAHPWEVVWAEDGAVYVPDAIHYGLGSLLRGSDGYVQLASRLVAAPAAFLPLDWVAGYLAIASALVSALLAAFVHRSTACWIASQPMRLLVAAFYVLGPAAAWEQTGNATNMIWVVLAATPWALVSMRRSMLDVAARVVVVVVAALSQPLAVLFVPLAAAVAWRRRSRDAWLVGGAFLVAMVLQALLMAVAPPRHASTATALGTVVWSFATGVLGSFLIGEPGPRTAWIRWGRAAGATFAAVTALVVAISFVGASARNRVLGAVLALSALALGVGPILSNGIAPLVDGVAPQPIQRYVFVPVALLVGAVAVLLDAPDRSRERWIARVGRPLLVVQSILVIGLSFSMWNPRSNGPLWRSTVERAEVTCETSGVAQLDIAPAGWLVLVPCEDVTR